MKKFQLQYTKVDQYYYNEIEKRWELAHNNHISELLLSYLPKTFTSFKNAIEFITHYFNIVESDLKIEYNNISFTLLVDTNKLYNYTLNFN